MYWTGDLVSVLIRGQLRHCLISSQFLVYPRQDPDEWRALSQQVSELKPLPILHADGIQVFWSSSTCLLSEGALQAEAQALCLFCSSRFGSQDVALIVTGAGDYYRICRVTRSWSLPKLKRERGKESKGYTSETLKDLKKAAKLRLDLEDDGDWTEGKETEMYGEPSDAKERQQTLYEQRVRQQAEERCQHALA
ncbi:hypothetical protein DFH07DRAFT_775974 [Mycena maculata]|uniref:Uncharacterized protein n=1 Tax=Mycena maculata TaxID=230809 RepID=A0AAD7IPB2_9AGAR|nr:hypothetical protein DFH07DRAFT_775974 [Mycena maculata]